MSILRHGRSLKCPAPAGSCICEEELYTTTGVLALIAGLIQWVVGYKYSMAALSDSLHALTDAFADFLAVVIVKKNKEQATFCKESS